MTLPAAFSLVMLQANSSPSWIVIDRSFSKRLPSRCGWLYTDLVSPENMSGIYTLAELLPTLSGVILECRLGASESRVDLEVFIPNPSIKLPDPIPLHPVWRRFQDICQDWAQRASKRTSLAVIFVTYPRVLCAPAKRNALLAWQGYDLQGLSIFCRLTVCIKIVCQQGIPLEAKAYLGFWHE